MLTWSMSQPHVENYPSTDIAEYFMASISTEPESVPQIVRIKQNVKWREMWLWRPRALIDTGSTDKAHL